MIFTVFDIIMARSLRSLAGFCMGEYRDFELERNIYITTSDSSIFENGILFLSWKK